MAVVPAAAEHLLGWSCIADQSSAVRLGKLLARARDQVFPVKSAGDMRDRCIARGTKHAGTWRWCLTPVQATG